jgi:tRNA(Ile)-lysidine synthase
LSPRARPTPTVPDPAVVGRFAAELDRLVPAGERIGVAVSGGPDSLALLILAAATRTGAIEAATVDHALRPESKEEAAVVARVCGELGVPHSTLTVEWDSKPETAIQERARVERYRLLGRWAAEREIVAIATAHHLDDQAETLLMRLNRGAGVRGLGGMRPESPVPGAETPFRLIRPLLGWRRSELAGICAAAGVAPVDDPSNEDEQFERVRVRHALAEATWLDAEGVAASASHLGSAEEALCWATDVEWDRRVERAGDTIVYRPEGPMEIRRRVLRRIVDALASEGGENALRGRELDRIVAVLSAGGKATIRGVLCSGGEQWRFAPAPRRTAR